MTEILEEVLAANRAYAATFGDKGKLAMPPTDEVMRGLLAQSLETAALDAEGWHDPGRGPGATEGVFVDRLTIRDQVESVVADVRRIRSHPLVPGTIPVYGYIYDVGSGRLAEVPEAAAVGRVL